MEQESPSSTVKPPETVRQLQMPAALALADLTAIFEDLTKVVGCCEQTLSVLEQARPGANEILVESLWTTALVSYRRCFSAGKHGAGLSEQDLDETGLQGDVAEWHKTLEKLREHYVDTGVDPRESFVVGAAQDVDGNANGIAITSAPQPQLDETTVRQTGQLALELSRVVDQRIKTQQESVYNAARAMSPDDLSALALVHVADPEGAERD